MKKEHLVSILLNILANHPLDFRKRCPCSCASHGLSPRGAMVVVDQVQNRCGNCKRWKEIRIEWFLTPNFWKITTWNMSSELAHGAFEPTNQETTREEVVCIIILQFAQTHLVKSTSIVAVFWDLCPVVFLNLRVKKAKSPCGYLVWKAKRFLKLM